MVPIPLDISDSSHVVYIRSEQSKGSRAYLVEFLHANINNFTWMAKDLPNVNLEFIVHYLIINLLPL